MPHTVVAIGDVGQSVLEGALVVGVLASAVARVLLVAAGVERLRRDDEAQAAGVAVDVLGRLLLFELDVHGAAEALAVHREAAVARHVLLEDDALGGAAQPLVAEVAAVERVQHRLPVVRVDVERRRVHRHVVHASVKHLQIGKQTLRVRVWQR